MRCHQIFLVNVRISELGIQKNHSKFVIIFIGCIAGCVLEYNQFDCQKVYEEVMDVLGPHKLVEPSDLPKLKYLERVIKETLRLFPVGPIIVRKIEEDIQLTTCVVPGGVSAVIGIHHLHKNPKYWPDPMVFNPDRFLPEEVAKRHPYSYMPFSGGPRNCIGVKYGMMAMKCLASNILRSYKVYSGYRSIEEIELKSNIVLRPCNGFKVSFVARQ